jgi:hypothetical protein
MDVHGVELMFEVQQYNRKAKKKYINVRAQD